MQTETLERGFAPRTVVKKRVATLTNILLRHNVVVLEALDPLLAEMRTLLSTRKENERKASADWGSLDVVVQKSILWKRNFTNVHGYRDSSDIQVPYDTLSQLWRYHPDVVISGQFGGRTLFAALYKLLRPRTTFIVWATLSQRTEATRGRLLTLLRKAILRCADGCFTHGPDGETYLRSLGFKRPVFYTPYVIEPGSFEGASLVPDDRVVRLLYTGQFIERKGVVPFVTALIAWCEKNPETQVLFRLGGEGPEQARLQALVTPPNLTLEFPGYLDSQAIALAYRQTSICVFPTLGDEWGMVVNESLSAGVPVLASRHAQATLELIQHGSNGWIFDPTDDASMAENLDTALRTDFDRLRQMSASARASVALMTPQIIAERMAAAIETLTNDPMPTK